MYCYHENSVKRNRRGNKAKIKRLEQCLPVNKAKTWIFYTIIWNTTWSTETWFATLPFFYIFWCVFHSYSFFMVNEWVFGYEQLRSLCSWPILSSQWRSLLSNYFIYAIDHWPIPRIRYIELLTCLIIKKKSALYCFYPFF